jgi:glyoxylase I family protein
MRMSGRTLGATAIALALTIGGRMSERAGPQGSAAHAGGAAADQGLATVRYQITNVDRAITFYTRVLDFKLEQKTGTVSPWSRLGSYISDLNGQIQKLKAAGAHLRNSVEVGPGGKQIQVDDPDGNPIELHEGEAGAAK